MRATIIILSLAFGLSVAAGCESEAEERAEERVEAEMEARGEEGLEADLAEIGAGEVAEFEREAKEGDALGLEVYEEMPRTAEDERGDPLREAVLGEEEGSK
jgi:hypothetical protein